MLRFYPTYLFFLVLIGIPDFLIAQKDTEFWFVAPEISQGANNYDRPVAFRFSTYDLPANITISQPANPAFPVQTLNIAANTSGIFEFPPYFDVVENTPANTILNKGFLIKSTSPITAYYEVIGEFQSNPEIFSLKGKNALGTSFFVPFQNKIENSSAYSPLPYSSFDIVATEDNTTVSVTPKQNIVGHSANLTFNINLNRGQTYSARAASQGAVQHPTGSTVSSNKPIAITIKDDLLEGGTFFGGFCRDLMGDQIVPIEKTGTKYVVQKGLLTGTEFAFVVATANSTLVKLDGITQGTINAGQTLAVDITSGSHFLETSAPAYVWQLTGNGCEVAGEILPTLDCSGSSEVRFVRTNAEDFVLYLVTKAGNQGGFTLNGNGALIPASAFQVVPGSNGAFVAAALPFTSSQVVPGASSIVSNSAGVFQMGFLNGTPSGTGCRFAFFSDFGNQTVVQENVEFCSGESFVWHGMTIDSSGFFTTTVSSSQCCDTVFELTSTLLPFPATLSTISLCPGQSITIGGISYDQPGVVIDTIPSLSGGCDTLATYVLLRADQPVTYDTLSLCPGESLNVHGNVYSVPGTYLDTLYSTSPDACDTLAYTTLVPAPMDLEFQIEEVECDGGTIRLSGVLCNLGAAPLPDEVWIRIYNANPFNGTPSASMSFLVGAANADSCLNLLLDGIDLDVVENGVVYSMVSDDGSGSYPLSADDFPITNVVECNYANNLSITNFTPPAQTPLDLGPDVHLCASGTVVFDVGNDFIAYLWQDGSTGQTFSAGSPGSYHVEVKDACGRVQRDTVQFSMDTVFQGQLADLTLCLGQSGSANVDGYDTYAWSPAAGLSCADCGTVTIQPTETTTYTIFAETAGGCTFSDTFTVTVLPLPTQALTVGFCPGDGVIINGQFYTQSGTVIDTVASTDGSCDKILTYTLIMLPNPTISQTIEFCPGDAVIINGQSYTQPGIVVDTLPAGMDEGCDTIATYTLSWLPQPSFTQTIQFCKGDEVIIDGQTYTEPGTILDTLPSTTGGCDTLATYVLQYLTPTVPTAVSIHCPSDISVEAAPGQTAVVIHFDPATATSDCPCPGIFLHQTSGLPSNSAFPVGNTQVCFSAADSCGNTASCCFNVAVQAAAEPCDVKTIGCVKFELLEISTDAELNRRYTIRLTNNCSNRLIYTAIQVPDGYNALYPVENSTFVAPSGRTYLVRNPNYSPFYSVRFKSVSDSIANGEYDVFQYRLPAQAADPLFIHAMVRLEPQIYYEVHLNTFYCPVIPETGSKPDPGMEQEREPASGWLRVFPNPTDGTLWVSLSEIPQQPILLQIFNAQGERVQEQPVQAPMDEAVQLLLRPELPNGLYYLHMIADDGVPQVVRFVLQR